MSGPGLHATDHQRGPWIPRQQLKVFLSYRRSDTSAQARRLQEGLVREGFAPDNVFIDLDQEVGASYVAQIERALQRSDVLIALVGPTWLIGCDSQGRTLRDPLNWTHREIATALDLGVTVIPVCVSGASMPSPEDLREPSLAEFALLQALHVSDLDADLTTLADRLDRVERRVVSNLRAPNSSFVGRQDLLDRISEQLAASGPGVAVVGLVGLPAVGKTQLAVEFARRHRADYRIVWEIPAEHPAARLDQFGALARSIEVPELQDQVAAVRSALEARSDWLLLFDNAKDPADLLDVLPASGGHVLITSQRAAWEEVGAVVVPVDVMTEPDAVALLRRRLPTAADEDLRRLAERLMYLPLALEQAAGLLRAWRAPVEEFLDLLEEEMIAVLDEGAPRDYERTLVGTWRLALVEVEEASSRDQVGAKELLSLCAFLAPDDIPLRDLAEHADVLPEPLDRVLGKRLARRRAVGMLADYSHLRWNADGTVVDDSVSLHRIVQHLAREHLTAHDQRVWGGAALRLVLRAVPEDPSDVSSWKTCRRLLPHATVVLEHAARLGVDPLLVARLQDRIGIFVLRSTGRTADAQAAFGRALAGLDENDPEHRATAATVRNHLGSVLRERGDFDGAYENHAAALRVHEATCGPGSAEVADDLVEIGRALLHRDDLAGAADAFERALRIRSAVHGVEHPSVGEVLGELAGLHLRTGDVRSARDEVRRALAIRENLGQSSHPEAIAFRFLEGRLTGDVSADSAVSRLEHVVSVVRDAFGENHPELADWRLSLGDTLVREMDFEAAEESYREALRIDELVYGDDHWRTGRDLLRMLLIEATLGRREEARRSLLRAVAVLQRVPVDAAGRHEARRADVSTFVLGKVDEAFDSLGAIDAAVRPFEDICGLVAEALGKDSLIYASSLEHFAVELAQAGRPHFLELAEQSLSQALAVFRERLGGDHRRVTRGLRHRADVRAARGDIDGAATDYTAALAGLEAEGRPDNVELIDVLTGLYRVLTARERGDRPPPVSTAPHAGHAATSALAVVGPPSDGSTAPVRAALSAGDVPAADGASFAVDQAQAVLQRAYEVAQSFVGEGPLIRLAQALADAGQLAHALELHERVLTMLTEAYGGTHPYIADWLYRTAKILTDVGEPERAIRAYDDALAIHRAVLGPEADAVAADLRGRAMARVRADDVGGAVESLRHSLAITERRGDVARDVIERYVVASWAALGDAAATPEAAHALYALASEQVGDLAGSEVLTARLGGVLAARDEADASLDLLRRAASQHLQHGGTDPFWTVVRAARPGARYATDADLLTQALTRLREDPVMEEHLAGFRPQLSGIIPQGWFTKESVTLVAPDGQANVICSSEPLAPEIDTVRYAEMQGELLAKEFPSYTEHELRETATFGGRRGFLRRFEWTPPDGVRIAQIQLYYAEEGRGYTATATTPSQNLPAVEAELLQVLVGLQIGAG